jgi:hypothetical protein
MTHGTCPCSGKKSFLSFFLLLTKERTVTPQNFKKVKYLVAQLTKVTGQEM